MKIEVLIYIYLAICVSMILFNFACILVLHGRDERLQRRSAGLEKQILAQEKLLEEGSEIGKDHKRYLKRKMLHATGMMEFDQTMEKLYQSCPELASKYLEAMHPVFEDLSFSYSRRDTMKISYFAYLVEKYGMIRGRAKDGITETMLSLLQDPSIYCRENALSAIYSVGDCNCVVRALQIMDDGNRFHHPKLLTDGLMSYAGEAEELADALWNSYGSFSAEMQCVILDYLRFRGIRKDKDILKVLTDDGTDDEVRFSCIRYFGKFPNETAYPILLEYAKHPDRQRWEYASIAVSSLASYPVPHTLEVLKECLHHPNWYIRLNASKSLRSFHLSYTDLIDVFDGADRYAREITQYMIDEEKAKENRR